MEENLFSSWLKENFYPSSIVFATDRAKSIIAKNNLTPSEFLRPFGLFSEIRFNQSEKFNITLRNFKMDFYDSYNYKSLKLETLQPFVDNLLLSPRNVPDWNVHETKITRERADPLLSKLKYYSFPWFNEYESMFMEFIRFYEFELYQQPISYVYMCSIDDNINNVLPTKEKIPPLIYQGIYETNMPVLIFIVNDLSEKEHPLTEQQIQTFIAQFKSKFKNNYILYLPINSNDPTKNPIKEDIWKDFIHRLDLYSPEKKNTSDVIRGQYISLEERAKIRSSLLQFMNIYTVKMLEEKIRIIDKELSEKRKGIKNTLFTFFKAEKPEYNSFFGIYKLTPLEQKEYLLSILLFYFRNYEEAYENLKLFMADVKSKSIHHYNAALELSTICGFMMSPDTKDRDFISPYQHYLRTHQYVQALRALLLMTRVYEQKRMFNIIPTILIRATRELPHSLTSTIKSAASERVISRLQPLLLEKASVYYLLQKEKLMKKFSLYIVLAGLQYRNDNPNLIRYTFNCYGNLFNLADEKNFSFVRTKEYLNQQMGEISVGIKYYEEGLKFFKNCLSLGKYSNKDIKKLYNNMIMCLKEVKQGMDNGSILGSIDLTDLSVPEVDNTSLLILEEQDYQISEDKRARGNWMWFNKFSIVPLKKIYLSLSPADIISLRNLDNIIAKKQNFSNFYSKRNFKGNVNNKMYVRFQLKNPLNFALVITNMKLICDFTPLTGEPSEKDIEYQNLEFVINPYTSKEIELYCKPLVPGHCIMKGVEITLDNIAVIKHYFNTKNLSQLYNYRRKRKSSSSSDRKSSTGNQHSHHSNSLKLKNPYNRKADITFDIIDNESDIKVEFPMGNNIEVYKNQLVLIPVKIINNSPARIKRFCLFFKEDDLSDNTQYISTNQNVLCDYIYKEIELINHPEHVNNVTIYLPVIPKKVGELYIKILCKFEEEAAFKDNEVKKYFLRLKVNESVEFDIKEKIMKFDSEEKGSEKKKITFSLDTIAYIANKAKFSNLKIGNVYSEPEYIREDNTTNWDIIENKEYMKLYHKFTFSKKVVIKPTSLSSFFNSFSSNFSIRKRSGDINDLATNTNFDFLPSEINNDAYQFHIKNKLSSIMLRNNLLFTWSCTETDTNKEIKGIYLHQTSLRLPKANLNYLKELLKTISTLSTQQQKVDDSTSIITLNFNLDKSYLSELSSVASYEIFINEDIHDRDYKWFGNKRYKEMNNYVKSSEGDNILKGSFSCFCYRKGRFDINVIGLKFNLKDNKEITLYNSPCPAFVTIE